MHGRLALTRKPNESIIIGKDIRITVVQVSGKTVKLSIEAPKEIPIVREELLGAPVVEKYTCGGSR